MKWKQNYTLVSQQTTGRKETKSRQEGRATSFPGSLSPRLLGAGRGERDPGNEDEGRGGGRKKHEQTNKQQKT